MPVLFACPHCGAETEVEDVYLGQTGPCYCCGKNVTVPRTSKPDPVFDPDKKSSGTKVGMVMAMVLAVTLVVVGLLGVAFLAARPVINQIASSTQQSACEGNLAQIATALELYHDTHGVYPPPYFADENGKPIHSWRVMILPQLGYKWLYDRYDFNQPWDSPQNLMIISQMPSVFGCPLDTNGVASFETSYMVVVGQGPMFPPHGTVSNSQISDGLAGTAMLVEVAESQVGWTEPKDLDARTMTFEVNGGGYGDEISSLHSGGAVYITADGKTHFLPDNTPPDFVEALITIRGGEQITPQEIEEF